MNCLLRDFVQSGEVEIKTGPFGTQLKASEYVEQGTPVLNVKNLGYSTVVRSKLDHVGPATLERLNMHVLHTGDIVFGRKGAVDRHAYISRDEEGWMQGSDCIRVRVKTQRINPRYLSYCFLTPKHRAFMISMCSHGTTMASLNQKILEMIEVPLPNRYVQDRIVALLESMDEKIKLNQKINDNLQQHIQTIFADAFPNIFQSGCNSTLESLISFFNGKKRPNAVGKIPVYGGNGVLAYTDVANAENCVVIGRVGAYCGNTFFCPEKCWISDNAIQAKAKDCNSQLFIYYLLKNANLPNRHIGTGQPLMTQGILNAIPINLPQRERIQQFTEICSPLQQMIDATLHENQQLSLLRDSLLPKLISGEIDVSDIQL